jgi:hypothetical protein
MGYYLVTSPCVSCKHVMSYHPHKVPSIRVNGTREPLCRSCIERANPIRIENGLEAIPIAPDAYEPCAEEEF